MVLCDGEVRIDTTEVTLDWRMNAYAIFDTLVDALRICLDGVALLFRGDNAKIEWKIAPVVVLAIIHDLDVTLVLQGHDVFPVAPQLKELVLFEGGCYLGETPFISKL